MNKSERITKELKITKEFLKEYTNLSIDLARIIQRLEREKADLTVDDIKTVWKLKTLLGYSNPENVEEGTGSLITK